MLFSFPRLFLLSAAAAAFAVSVGPVAAATATLASDPATVAAFEGGDPAVRFRAQTPNQDELYVGRADLGQGANRSAANLAYVAAQTFSFAYAAATGIVSASYGGTSRSFALAAGLSFNALRIEITGPRNNSTGGLNSFSLSGVSVNGQMIPDLAGTTTVPRRTLTWIVGGLTGDLTVSGRLNYAGPLGGNGSAEGAKVDLRAGSLPPVPLPPALAMLLLALAGLTLAGLAGAGRRVPLRV